MAATRFKLDKAQGERPVDDLATPVREVVELPKGPFAQPTKDLDQAMVDLDQWGYAIIDSVLSPDEVETLRAALMDAIAADEVADPNAVKGAYTFRDDKSRYLGELPARGKQFLDLLEHPVALEMTRRFFGPQYLDESYLVFGATGIVQKAGAMAQGIHADQDHVRPYHDAPLQLRMIWMLTDFTEEIGATRIVPGSHTWGHMADKSGATRYETVAATAPAGSLLLWDNRTYHAAGANQTDIDRPVLVVGYGPSWIRPMTNYPLVLDPKVVEDASPTVRRLLGYTSVALGFDHPWTSARPEVQGLVVPHK